ncbi:hypothetical protein WA026_009342 [Henosepilachna vigintioctopunctata]|uniref:Uncharacterized protein n=1 Tax=Henosepilachna vigintioctopunctata TaxID=420089 RepID=A0AAW1UVG1_9CUCU
MLVIGITYFALIFISSVTSTPNKNCEIIKFSVESNIARNCCLINAEQHKILKDRHGEEYNFIVIKNTTFVCSDADGKEYNTKNIHERNYNSHDKEDDIPRIANYKFGDGGKRRNCPKGKLRFSNGICESLIYSNIFRKP